MFNGDILITSNNNWLFLVGFFCGLGLMFLIWRTWESGSKDVMRSLPSPDPKDIPPMPNVKPPRGGSGQSDICSRAESFEGLVKRVSTLEYHVETVGMPDGFKRNLEIPEPPDPPPKRIIKEGVRIKQT